MPDLLAGQRLQLKHTGQTDQQTCVIGIAGSKGSGKSEVVREIGEHAKRWFSFDTTCEHRWIPDRFDSLEDADWFLLDTASTRETFHGAYLASGDEPDTDLNRISDAVYDAGNLTFNVEEVPLMSGPGHAPKKFMKVVRTGRHVNVNVVWTCQRLAEAPVTLRSATDIFILFHHAEPLDLSAISERCTPEVATAVSRLGDHDFLVWQVRGRKVIAYSELRGVVLPRFQL